MKDDDVSTTQKRLQAAWEAAEEDCKKAIFDKCSSAPSASPSPQTASLLDWNVASSAPLPPSQFNGSSNNTFEDPFLLPPSEHEISPRKSPMTSSCTSTQQQLKRHNMILSSPPSSLLQRYRIFLQKHEPLFSLVEMIMERFVFYGHLFKVQHNLRDNGYTDEGEKGRIIRTEIYYATWNIIRWINDLVLLGVGDGMGLTVGTRDEWLLLHQRQQQSSSTLSNSRSTNSLLLQEWITSRMDIIITIIRATLTATTCLYPAVEAFSSHHYIDNNMRRHRAALVCYRLERVRFMGRLALLLISWWTRVIRHQKRRQQQQSLSSRKEREKNIFISSIVLQRGGELDPYEKLVSLEDAEDEARVVQYVGRRTGRRSVSSGAAAGTTFRSYTTPHHHQGFLSTVLSSFPFITNATNNVVECLSELWTSSFGRGGNKLVYVYAVGEILHILRPFIWSLAECSEWQRKVLQQQRRIGRGFSFSWSIWKAYWISLLMDLISDNLLRLTSSCDGDGDPNKLREGLLGELHSRDDDG